jgi:membrane protein CcdC involved in cytochrome C biogenesis
MNRNIIIFSLIFVLLLATISISVRAQAVDNTTTDKSLISSAVTGYSGETMSMTREAIDNDYLAALLLLVTLGLLTKVVTHYTVRSSDQVNTKQSISLNIQGVNKKRH